MSHVPSVNHCPESTAIDVVVSFVTDFVVYGTLGFGVFIV